MSVIEGVGDEVTVVAALLIFVFVIIATLLYQNFSLEDFLDATWPWESYFTRRQVQSTAAPGTLSDTTAGTERSSSPEPDSRLSNSSDGSDSEAPIANTPSAPVISNGSIENTAEESVTEIPPVETSTEIPPVETSGPINASNDANDSSQFQQAVSIGNGQSNQTDANELNAEDAEPLPPNAIRVRLKYMNDTERIVTTQLTETVGSFKRTHFLADLTANKTIRLIFNGQVLQDNMTLHQCRVEDRTVLHVLITQVQPQPNYSSTAHSDLDISSLMWPLFSIVLGICWVMYIRYPELFSVTSIVLLVAFTGSFLVVYMHSQVQVP